MALVVIPLEAEIHAAVTSCLPKKYNDNSCPFCLPMQQANECKVDKRVEAEKNKVNQSHRKMNFEGCGVGWNGNEKSQVYQSLLRKAVGE